MKSITLLLLIIGVVGVCLGNFTCKQYDDIVDPSIQTLDYRAYEGDWYVASTNEPSEPSFCHCDVFNWQMTSNTTFSDPDSVKCLGIPRTIDIVGNLSTDPTRLGMCQEGSPPRYPIIPSYIVYVEGPEKQYNATIRYSCQQDYVVGFPPFFYILFESVQIWTRDQVTSQENLDRLVGIATQMGIVSNPSTLRNLTYEGCH